MKALSIKGFVARVQRHRETSFLQFLELFGSQPVAGSSRINQTLRRNFRDLDVNSRLCVVLVHSENIIVIRVPGNISVLTNCSVYVVGTRFALFGSFLTLVTFGRRSLLCWWFLGLVRRRLPRSRTATFHGKMTYSTAR